MSNLTSDKVNRIFEECLYNEGESTEGHKEVHAIRHFIGFNPERVEKNKESINEMLLDLPKEFLSEELGGGGGWSFLNACEDKDGNQWTDYHDTMDKLVALGLATEKLAFLMPRDIWTALPGGMPYFVINK